MTSRRIRSGSSVSTRSSAARPSVAVTTLYPRGTSTASSKRTFSGTSSTTRILGGCSLTIAVVPNGLEQLGDVDWLGEVSVEPGNEEPLAVAAHRLRGQRQHGNRGGGLVLPELLGRLEAVDAR